jgi:uncharacterized protein (DUF2147 family)
MKRLCAFAALVLLSTSAHAGTIFSFEVQGRVVHINAPSGCTSLACISVSSPEFHGSNYRRGSRTRLASKAVSASKARAPAATPNSLSLAKTPNTEDAIAAPRTTLSTANSKRSVVATEPAKAPSIDMPAAPAPMVETRPSADPDTASGPGALTNPMPVDATSDGSASPANVTSTSSRSPSPPTAEPATPVTGGVHKPVQAASSSAPAIQYYGKAKENQTATPAEDGIAHSRTPIATANSKRAVVATEPAKAPSVDAPATPATVVGTQPSPTMATSSRTPAPSTDEPATPVTGSVYKPVQTASSPAPAVEYYGKAKEGQTAPAVGYYGKAKENQNRETSDGDRPTSLLGNWQTEGEKRAIHIEQCGSFVCGYVADSSNADSSNNEKVLIDLKPTSSSSEWIGLIVSAESGVTYPSVVVLEDTKTLRVRACGLSMAFCEGQIWTREDPVLAAVH